MAATLRSVEVGADSGQTGWLIRTKLVDRLGESGEGTPAYRLDVTLDDNITAFGIRSDRAATRERRTLRARYQLVDFATGSVLLDATAGSDAGIDIVSSALCDRRCGTDRPRATVRRRRGSDRRAPRALCVAFRAWQVKASKASVGRAVDQPDPRRSVFIFFTVRTRRNRGRWGTAAGNPQRI